LLFYNHSLNSLKHILTNMMANKDLKDNQRRRFLKILAGVPFISLSGVLGMSSGSERSFTGYSSSGESDQQLNQLKGKLPEGKLGNLTVSRIIMGCNPIIAWSHARDLIYTNRLMKAYMTDEKIIETLHLTRQSGINTYLLTTEAYPLFHRYSKTYNEKLQTIAMATMPEKDILSNINLAVDNGADAIYIHGRVCDAYARSGNMDDLGKAVEHIRKQGLQAGIGAHCRETIEKCEKDNFPSDFYMKTFHNDKYWSALPEVNREPYIEIGPSYTDHNKYCENMWDLFPDRTVEVMHNVKKPFIAFKTLAAGAIPPKTGFRYAFENGADFVCVGMFDFQIIENVNVACEILGNINNRERKWYS
jgi:hypothetical protein